MKYRICYLILAGWLCTMGALTAAEMPYCENRVYAPLDLAWNPDTSFSQVRNIFPHPVMAQRALLATESGLSITEDGGLTWKELPQGGAGKIGQVTDIAFDPLSADSFYAATTAKGVWMSRDDGGTFTQIGSKAQGMAADAVASIAVYAGDPTRRTLLAVHGDTAPGMSRSRDAGQTWDVLNTDYNFRRVMGGGENSQQLFLFGSGAGKMDEQNCYTCNTVGEFPVVAEPDVVPTDMTRAPVREKGGDVVYIATSDSGIYRIANDDSVAITHDTRQLTVPDVTGWASVATAWGPNADVMRLFAYDPANLGLVYSTDNLATTQIAGKEVLVSPLVKAGSAVRSNANGTTFYAVVNGALFIGRSADDVPVVGINPPVFRLDGNALAQFQNLREEFEKFSHATEFSRMPGSIGAAAIDLAQRFGDLKAPYEQCQVTVTARLPHQPAPPASVTVDLSRFGGSPETPLYDDGQHDDGAAGDGLYGLTFALQPRAPSDLDWRSTWPGRVALGVTAAYPDGHRQGAVAVLGIYPLLKDFDLWSKNGGNIAADCNGQVKVRPVLNPPAIHSGSSALRLDAAKGPWTVEVEVPARTRDFTSYGALSFWIKAADGQPPKDLSVQLRDQPEFSDPTTTPPLPVYGFIAEGGISGEYRRAVIPLARLLGSNSQLQTTSLKSIILTGTTDGPVTLYVDGPRVHVSARSRRPRTNEANETTLPSFSSSSASRAFAASFVNAAGCRGRSCSKRPRPPIVRAQIR